MSHEMWVLRIDHMLRAIEDIEEHVSGLDYPAFLQDKARQQAVLWNFQILGEAIRHVPESVRDRHPDLPWRVIRATRNIIVHHYEIVRLDVIWDTAASDLNNPKQQLHRLRDETWKGED